MEGKAKVVVYIDGKEPMEFEGECVFLVITKSKGENGVHTDSVILANATAKTIGRAIAEMEEKIDEVKRENPVIALKAIEWKLQLADERCDELLKKCEEIIAGGDDE